MKSKTEQYLRLIYHMMNDSLFDPASDFIISVKDYIIKNNRITEKQIKAIDKLYIKYSEKE